MDQELFSTPYICLKFALLIFFFYMSDIDFEADKFAGMKSLFQPSLFIISENDDAVALTKL